MCSLDFMKFVRLHVEQWEGQCESLSELDVEHWEETMSLDVGWVGIAVVG